MSSASITTRVQLTSDGLRLYEGAVQEAFGADVDYAQLIRVFGADREGEQRYSPAECKGIRVKTVQSEPDAGHISTSYVERHNLTMRMSMRRFTRLTNAFSKKLQNPIYALALYFVWYNWCRIHRTLRVTPAMEADLTDTLYDFDWLVGVVEAAAAPQKPGPKPGTKYCPRRVKLTHYRAWQRLDDPDHRTDHRASDTTREPRECRDSL